MKFSPNALIALLTDSKEKTALLGIAAVFLTLFGVNEQHQTLVISAITLITSLLVAGQAFAQGKLNEGVVPPTMDQILEFAKALASSGTLGKSSGVTMEHVDQAVAKYKEIAGVLTQAPPAPAAPSITVNNVAKSLALAFGLSLMFFVAGCATSVQFKTGAKQFVPDIVSEASMYISADHSLVGDPQAQRLSDVARLAADVANFNSIDRNKVTADWNAVKAWYLPYVDADQNLTDAERALRHDVVLRFDQLIAHDAGRPFAKLVAPATQPTTQPAH